MRGGAVLELPTSRKVRALIAYLALAARPVLRRELCDLLWDVPSDPRGELRWCLSKVRRLIDEPGRRRVEAAGDAIRLDLSDGFVDTAEVAAAMRPGAEQVSTARLRSLAGLFTGDFLAGLEIDRNPQFQAWLMAQRRRFRDCHIAVLEALILRAGDAEDVLGHAETWLGVAPFELRAHEIVLGALARRNRLAEADAHLAATRRLFEAEGLDSAPLRDLWRRLKSRPRTAVMPVSIPAESAPAGAENPIGPSAASRRASIAVMPFLDPAGERSPRGGIADGLTHDVITRLAKLRTLFVIAQGTVFSLGDQSIGPKEAGQMLGVDYIASGSLRQHGGGITVRIELAERASDRIVWADVVDSALDSALHVLDSIVDRIVAAIAGEIEAAERNRAILKPPSSLDAWGAHHRGLWHMYRFRRTDNDLARHFFEMAVRLDPTFARAHAGLSFTHWQSAFQGWGEDRQRQIDRAYEAAGQSLILDDRDPAAHWAMGRALWLRGGMDQAIAELERAVDLSPNFALGHYALAFVHAQAGDPSAAISASDRSRDLSPFDPLLFAMLASRALALVRLGRLDEAADWALKAAARPNAHVHILATAAHCLTLAGRLEEGRGFIAAIRQTIPDYGFEHFASAFRFAPDAAAIFREAAKRIGIA